MKILEIKEVCPILDFYKKQLVHEDLLKPLQKNDIFRVRLSNPNEEYKIINSLIYKN